MVKVKWVAVEGLLEKYLQENMENQTIHHPNNDKASFHWKETSAIFYFEVFFIGEISYCIIMIIKDILDYLLSSLLTF